jgi:hypothetical protein
MQLREKQMKTGRIIIDTDGDFTLYYKNKKIPMYDRYIIIDFTYNGKLDNLLQRIYDIFEEINIEKYINNAYEIISQEVSTVDPSLVEFGNYSIMIEPIAFKPFKIDEQLRLHPLITKGKNNHYLNSNGLNRIYDLEKELTVSEMIGFCKANIFKYKVRKKNQDIEDNKKIEKYEAYLKELRSIEKELHNISVRDAFSILNIKWDYKG